MSPMTDTTVPGMDLAALRRALEEDIGAGDVTTLATVPAGSRTAGQIVARTAGVVAGLPVAAAVFHLLDATVAFAPLVAEGATVAAGATLATLDGDARAILTGERTALNYLGHLSGIATVAARCAQAVAGTGARVVDTRKTTPGLRALEKYAVRMGGASNHRFGLSDGVLIKDNHIKAAGGISAAVAGARRLASHLLRVEVECETAAEVREALDAGADVILLDNMPLAALRDAVRLIRAGTPGVRIEASGGIGTDPERLRAVAETGVDFISLGALTHSAPNFDVSLELGAPQKEVPVMALTTTTTIQPIDVACDESQEARILPALVEWRAPVERAHHAGAERADSIPREYALMAADELDRRIAAARATLGDKLVILGHHYQREEIIKWADARGDSFKLAQFAASRPEADYILFCGVHFMAESADILSGRHQRVILPNPAAGCSMADMANIAEVEECWQDLTDLYRDEAVDGKQAIIPVTYMNSAADLKAFCGRHGGIVCTSSNAASVLRWAFERGRRVLFFPDEHLGRNTALAMGIPGDELVVWDQRRDFGGITDDGALTRARVVLWKGWCSTHQRFTVEQIAQARAEHPGARIVVHPECQHAVVAAADCNGSTEYIIKVVEASPAGTVWGVGTEVNLVKRLAREHPDKTIFCLDPVVCPCSTMYRIHPAYLAWVLEELVAGRVVNQVSVDAETATWAKVALERMLANRA